MRVMMLCVQDPGLHDAISSPHLYDMLKVTLAAQQPQLPEPIRARLNIYIWLVMYNCTISRWGYALVATTSKNSEALDFRDKYKCIYWEEFFLNWQFACF